MPIVAFQNRRTGTLDLVIEPKGDRHELPHLATAGIRYSLDKGMENRSFVDLGEDSIEFWCEAESVDVDVVHPSPSERLLWDICVKLGFCGGVVNGEPMHVTDLLPSTGSIRAEDFADLVIRAEGDAQLADDAQLHRWREMLAAKFIEHLGAAVISVEALQSIQRRPFDPLDPA